MQISFSVEVEQPPNNLPMYQLFYLGYNEIGKQGYKMLKNKFNDIECDWKYKKLE